MNSTMIETTETLDTEYAAHLDTCALTHAIQDGAFIRHDAALHLAQTAVEGGYTGGAVLAGVGDYGIDTALYTVIYPVNDTWRMWAGYLKADGRWQYVDGGKHQDVKTLRWIFCFTYSGTLYEVNPAEV